MSTPASTIDEFVGTFLGDLGAVLHAATVVIGDKLGLYKAMAELGPSSPGGLLPPPVAMPAMSRSG